tara:strand:- start:693 stop:839 length:147 start_codon:yes stop_codon:yes gene_type:complete
MDPAHDTTGALAIDGETESNSESDKDESSGATPSADYDSEESTYSIDH